MAVRYFCDRCGKETGPGELRSAELSLPPDPDVALDLCDACAVEVRRLVLTTDAGATVAVAVDGG